MRRYGVKALARRDLFKHFRGSVWGPGESVARSTQSHACIRVFHELLDPLAATRLNTQKPVETVQFIKLLVRLCGV